MQFSPPTSTQHSSIIELAFHSSLRAVDFEAAFSALVRHSNPPDLIPAFIEALLVEADGPKLLLDLPFPPSLHPSVDNFLDVQANNTEEGAKTLAAWRMQRNNFKGAAAALLPSLHRHQAHQGKFGLQALGNPGVRDGLLEKYLVIINLLACAGDDGGWLLTQKENGDGPKQKIVTIEEIRAMYQKELDRRSVIENDRFEFGFDGAMQEMEVDGQA